MDLSQIYSNRVKKKSITGLSVGSQFPTIETKDPTINKLEQNLMSSFAQIMAKEQPTPSVNTNTPEQVQSISFADAIKELIQMKKS